jgi:hypothetical protein
MLPDRLALPSRFGPSRCRRTQNRPPGGRSASALGQIGGVKSRGGGQEDKLEERHQVEELLQYGLTLIGIVYIVAQSYVFKNVRLLASNLKLLEVLVYCPSCVGFWVGLLLWKLGYYPFHVKALAGFEPGIVGCAIGAVWSVWGPNSDTWALDRGVNTDAE